MKSIPLFLGSLAAVIALSLASCGDRDSSAKKESNKPTTPESTTPATADPYPLTVCVVSGEELGSMGKPVVITHEGTEVRFCCDDCLPKFEADPETYLAKLKAGKPGDTGDTGPNQ